MPHRRRSRFVQRLAHARRRCARRLAPASAARRPTRHRRPARWPMAAKARSTPCLRRRGRAGQRHHCPSHGAGGAPIDAAYGMLASPEGTTAVRRSRAGRRHHRRRRHAHARRRAHDARHGRTHSRAARPGRAPIHDRRRRQQHQRRRRGHAGRAGRLAPRCGRTRRSRRGPRDSPRLRASMPNALDPRLARLRDHASCRTSTIRSTGERGATAIFGPQKGVLPAQLRPFDDAIARFAARRRSSGRPARRRTRPARAPRAAWASLCNCVGGKFHSGAEVVADLIGLDAALADADWAITGEGRSDAQTLLRKAPFVVLEHARAHGVPVTLVSGAVDAAGTAPAGHATSPAASACPMGRRRSTIASRMRQRCSRTAPSRSAASWPQRGRDRASAIPRRARAAPRGSGSSCVREIPPNAAR